MRKPGAESEEWSGWPPLEPDRPPQVPDGLVVNYPKWFEFSFIFKDTNTVCNCMCPSEKALVTPCIKVQHCLRHVSF